MKSLFDELSFTCSRRVTKRYSTSFSLAVSFLSRRIRNSIHGVYGFVRLADEIVDSFHGYEQEALLDEFELELNRALDRKISLNPILNSFQQVVHRFGIERELIDAFMSSMRADLHKQDYKSPAEYEQYIHGSADVVGLMCLRIFVDGDQQEYDRLKLPASKLGSAFQKVNFLRDFKDDSEILNRSYFPHVGSEGLTHKNKQEIIAEVEKDFSEAMDGIRQLPPDARVGVYMAYVYYQALLRKLKKASPDSISAARLRISNTRKVALMTQSYLRCKLNVI